MHASVVDLNGGAVALMAETGRGKSTLAAAFARNGHEFLSDDSVVVETKGSDFLAMPSHPSIRLWEDSEQSLLGEALMAPPVSFTSKGRFLAGTALPHCDKPKRLRVAYVLGAGEATTVVFKRLSAAEGLIAWAQHSFLLDHEDRTQLAAHFDAISRVANHIPCFLLDYPRKFEQLPEVLDAIARHTAELESR